MILTSSASDGRAAELPMRQVDAADLVAFEAVAGHAVGLIELLALFDLARYVEALGEGRCAGQQGRGEQCTSQPKGSAATHHAGHPTSGGGGTQHVDVLSRRA